MKRRTAFALLALSALLSPAEAFRQDRAAAFIESMYAPSRQLVRECPTCTNYWLWSDNFLAQIVLRPSDPVKSTVIARAIASYGVPMHSAWAVLDRRYIANVSFRSVTEKTARGLSDVRYSDYSGVNVSCADYADVAFLEAIYKYQTRDLWGARTCYMQGRAKWDGVGFHERWQPRGTYAVYKTALGLLAQKLTGFSPIGIPVNYFDKFQSPNGGIRTDIVNGQPAGLENVETTSAVMLAENPALLQGR